jgi:predicted type IV restriction endonuclease
MSIAMISVAPDVLNHLMTLRLSDSESLDEVFRRVLPGATKAVPRPAAQVATATPSASPAGVAYQFFGETHVASDATEAMINLLWDLARYDDNFFPKLAPKVRGRTRNHIARSRSEVYPGRPDLARYVKEVVPGWFIGCNIANREKEKILRAACEVMGMAFGQDLKIDLTLADRRVATP